jgi:hypothetical protein
MRVRPFRIFAVVKAFMDGPRESLEPYSPPAIADHRENSMNIMKLTLAAATLTVGLAATASALPVGNIGTVDVGRVQVDQVRLVCNRWGRCWHTRGYGYGYGYGHGYRRGYRHW